MPVQGTDDHAEGEPGSGGLAFGAGGLPSLNEGSGGDGGGDSSGGADSGGSAAGGEGGANAEPGQGGEALLLERAVTPACSGAFEPLGDFAHSIVVEDGQIVFRAGARFSNETWGLGLRAVFFRMEEKRLRYLGFQETTRSAGHASAVIAIPNEWRDGKVLFYVSYERKVIPMSAALGSLLAWHDSALFALNRDECVSDYATPVDERTTAGWTRLQHPQGALNDHAVFTELIDPPRKSASHFMNVPRFEVEVQQDAPGKDLLFEVRFAFAPDEERPSGAKSGVVAELEASGQEGQEERAGSPPGSPRHVFSSTCQKTQNNRYSCNLGKNFAYGQRVDWELRVVPEDTEATNLYTPMLYYVVGHGWDHESADPRALGAGSESIDSWGADASERATVMSQHTRLRENAEVMRFVAEHDAFRQPLGTDLQAGRKTCESCHINGGRSDAVFDIPGVGLRIAPPLIGLGLLARVKAEGRAYFGWQGNRATVEEAVRAAMKADFGIEAAEPKVLAALTHYSENLGVPQRDKSQLFEKDVLAGEELFREMGCASCHTEVQTTSDGVILRPYTDLRMHDLGKGAFRTSPLWALGRAADVVAFSLDSIPPGQSVKNAALGRAQRGVAAPAPDQVLYLHDGSAKGLPAAILAHGGEAKAATDAYLSANASEQLRLLAFLHSL